MNSMPSRRAFVRPTFGRMVAVLGLTAACGGNGLVDPSAPEWTAFIEYARHDGCADLRNRLFVIDRALVLSDRAGRCADMAYALTLFGKTLDDVRCNFYDSIAGPRFFCVDSTHQKLFETIVGHLDQPDLGLGPSHKVQPLPL